MWITVDTPVGWLLALTPAGLLAWGLFGVALGLLTAPWLLRRYGALARSLLAPVQSTKPQIN